MRGMGFSMRALHATCLSGRRAFHSLPIIDISPLISGHQVQLQYY